MKVDLGVTSPTANDYDGVMTKLEDIKGRVQDTVSVLSDKGWSGEAQNKYTQLVKWFISKDYERLQENLKCIKEVLSDDVNRQGVSLKNRCEDFVNAFDGSEIGISVYPESDGESAGILSLEYDNSGSVIDNIIEITNNLTTKKSDILKDLSKTIKGGWFSSGLLFSSLNIDNELAESFNEISKEDRRLNAFMQSFLQYTSGVKRLEEVVCSGLGKVKDLDTTVDKNMGTMDKAANMGIGDKALGILKTVTIDVVGGGLSCVAGGSIVTAGALGAEVTGGTSTLVMAEGTAMTVSGTNCAYNGGLDLYRELTGDWVDVGSTNLVKDVVTNTLKPLTNDKIANLAGSGFVVIVDGVGNIRGIAKTVVSLRGQIVNAGSDVINVGKGVPNVLKKQ